MRQHTGGSRVRIKCQIEACSSGTGRMMRSKCMGPAEQQGLCRTGGRCCGRSRARNPREKLCRSLALPAMHADLDCNGCCIQAWPRSGVFLSSV